MKTAMKTAILALVLAFSASAQFTIVLSTDARSDGQTVHEAVAVAYSGSCYGCGYAYHTWQGSLVDPGSGRNCSFNASAPASNSLNMGCALDIPLPWGIDQSFTGTASIKATCSVIGLLLSTILQTPPVKITFAYSAYKNALPCQHTTPLTWVCSVAPSGPGCPGKCTTSTTKVVVGTPSQYAQCTDVIVNGVCTAQACIAQPGQGYCTNGRVN